MSSNFQGRKKGKSVSFRGQSNDSNFYDNRPRNDSHFNENRQRNQYRDQSNYETSDQSYNDIESRVVKLLPDANMTISVQNDLRGSNKNRSRGSRGILKSHSFRDDTNLHNRSSDYYNCSSEFNSRSSDFNNRSSDYMDDYNSSRRGFETHPFQPNRSRNRARGFYNRSQHTSKFQEIDQETEYNREFNYNNEYNSNYNNDYNFNRRNKSDRSRRGRGSRGGGRGRSSYRNSDDHIEGPMSSDGNKEDPKDINNLENDSENRTNESEEVENPIISENCSTPFQKEENEKQENPRFNNCDVKSDAPESSETVTKSEDNKESEELEKKLDEVEKTEQK